MKDKDVNIYILLFTINMYGMLEGGVYAPFYKPAQ
jgi:hypothetical protein